MYGSKVKAPKTKPSKKQSLSKTPKQPKKVKY